MDAEDDYYSNPEDPIIAEIWKFREDFSKRFNGDIHAMAEEMRRQSAASGIPSITRPPKPSKGLPSRGSQPVDRNY